jgi:hypothetical protein
MPVFIAPGDPVWTFDEAELEKQVATFAKTNALTTQTAWLAFVATLGSPGSIEVAKGILRSVKCSVP